MPALATVIPIDRPRRGRPSIADDLRLELSARRQEELDAAGSVEPLLRRLELVAHEYGPAAWQLASGLAYWHDRHRRRWTDLDGAA